MSKIPGPSAAFAALAALLVASAASASMTSYAGTSCVQELTLSPSIVYQNSRASAYSTATTFFACPAAQQGGALVEAKASGRDLNPTASVSCHVEAMDEFDGAASFGASVSSGAEFIGSFTLDLPPPATTFPSGSTVVHCTMPPAGGRDGSSIGSYAITEM
ncbi:MAG TPA: hypothetical protein VER12_12195 [Polyangiaceae bacterium]|nr:hypothetical protein [Polyangiaceae bacterium]HYQ31420.1 hypothetical protein [Polyangiaceae bacterium]